MRLGPDVDLQATAMGRLESSLWSRTRARRIYSIEQIWSSQKLTAQKIIIAISNLNVVYQLIHQAEVHSIKHTSRPMAQYRIGFTQFEIFNVSYQNILILHFLWNGLWNNVIIHKIHFSLGCIRCPPGPLCHSHSEWCFMQVRTCQETRNSKLLNKIHPPHSRVFFFFASLYLKASERMYAFKNC